MRLMNLDAYEAAARERMEPAIWDTYAQGAEDEVTLRANRTAFTALRLRPRVLTDVAQCDTSAHVLGTAIHLPVLLAPTSVQRLAHPDGELATARAARSVGTIMVASTLSTYPLEAIAEASAGAPQWFQLYVYRECELTRQLLERVERAGYRAIVLTVDAPFIGNRERDRQNNFNPPSWLSLGNFADGANGATGEDITWQTRGERAIMTWDDIAWLRSLTSLPLILKGILTAEDASLAADYGVDAVIVSNHGGRQLDGSVSTIEALPEVVAALQGRCEVYVDGGIRRGTDILKALALGARAVLIGRPVIWGLTVDGERGVADTLHILCEELRLAMGLVGRSTLDSIDQSLLKTPWFFPPAPAYAL